MKAKHIYWKAVTTLLAPIITPVTYLRRKAITRKFDGRGMRPRDHTLQRCTEVVINFYEMARMGPSFAVMEQHLTRLEAIEKEVTSMADRYVNTGENE